ncbi:MAG: hypothetical protein QOF85_2161 [Solirubrobacterales bacterium]|jgi:hypothetical protein|nr:hypothetical protein [Solirubrobacterales bacterium]
MPLNRAKLWIAASIATVLLVGAASAHADAPIEGVWSFNGGKVAIQAEGEALVGIVVAPTKFTQCTHPVGERMWTEMRRRPDGSYWGLHQWFFATSECIANPTPGPTAWRVMRTGDGERFLRACFSEPGSGSQPTVAPDGTSAGATFGCVNSALVASLPAVSPGQFGRYVVLPSNRACISGSKLRIRIRVPRNDPLKKIVVALSSGKIHRRAKLRRNGKSFIAILNLGGLQTGPFTVKVRLTTVLGEHLSGGHTYVRCAKRRGHPVTVHRGRPR